MRYYFLAYETLDGEHSYTEYAVTKSTSIKDAEKRAKRGQKQFARYGWEEFCTVDWIMEIPQSDFAVLQKYFSEV